MFRDTHSRRSLLVGLAAGDMYGRLALALGKNVGSQEYTSCRTNVWPGGYAQVVQDLLPKVTAIGENAPRIPMSVEEVPDSLAARASTKRLLDLYKQGQASALELLLQREIPLLRSWAHGRLPRWARSMVDTADLIQGALTRSLPHLNKFEPKREKALQAYLRSAVANQIKDELRRFGRAPVEQLAEGQDVADSAPSASDQLIDRDNQRRFVEALQRLSDSDRAAVVARLELGYSYEQIALVLDKRSANTARMTVTRAVARLVEEMTGPSRS